MKKIFLIISLIFSASYANAGFNCSNVMDNDGVFKSELADKIGEEARLKDKYLNRYHIDVIQNLCRGNESGFDDLVNIGYVKRSDIESLREVLGLEKRTARGVALEKAQNAFGDMGMGIAQAQNIAEIYVDKPKSKCAKLARRALNGDKNAVDMLTNNLDICELP